MRPAVDYYIRQKGMNIVRFCSLWELIQPRLNEPLAPDQVRGISDQVKRITDAGAQVIIELHNQGRRDLGGKRYIIGETPQVTGRDLADVWTRIAKIWGRDPKVIFGLMNEPHDQDDAVLVRVTNEAIAAIRKTGARNLILVNGNEWGSYGWRPGKPNLRHMLDIVDPANNFAFDVHHYFDAYGTGKTPDVVPERVWMAGVRSFTSWARRHGRRGFCGEFATPATAEGDAAARTFLDYLDANADVWMGWTWWGGGGWWPHDYLFRLDPFGSPLDRKNPLAAQSVNWSPPIVDMPQMRVLEPYLRRNRALAVAGKA